MACVPLCEINPTSPASPKPWSPACRMPSLRLYRPMQFGPISVTLPSRAICSSCSCIAMPSGSPVSANPDVNSATPPTPFFATSAITRAATGRGTAIIT